MVLPIAGACLAMLSCTSDNVPLDISNDTIAPNSDDTDVLETFSGEAWSNADGCPVDDPAFGPWRNPADCDTTIECRYPAAACPSGALPDNVCRCIDRNWLCEGHARNCLPLSDDSSLDQGFRPRPAHRVASETCDSAADELEFPRFSGHFLKRPAA